MMFAVKELISELKSACLFKIMNFSTEIHWEAFIGDLDENKSDWSLWDWWVILTKIFA